MKVAVKLPLIAGICSSLLLAGCSFSSQPEEYAEVDGFKLDTYVSIAAYDDTPESVLREALGLCDKYEKIFSMQDTTSELWKLNNNETTVVSEELGDAINRALYMSELSGKRFQVSIGSVSRLWDFRGDNPEIPDDKLIKEQLAYVDDSGIKLTKADNGWSVSKNPGTVIDLGAVAKGYIADKIKDFLIEKGTKSAIINLGGNVCCLGDKDGEPFNIGVRKPFGELSDTVAVFKMHDASLITSGISERYFKKDGRIFHHILDPSTGYPLENNLYQVSVITKNSLDGDCLSTVCFTLGLDEGLKLVESLPDTEAVFITNDNELHYSSGAEQLLRRQ